jgi:hypothetical protein
LEPKSTGQWEPEDEIISLPPSRRQYLVGEAKNTNKIAENKGGYCIPRRGSKMMAP